MPLAHRIVLRMKYIAYHELNKIMYAKKHSENQSTTQMSVIHCEFSLVTRKGELVGMGGGVEGNRYGAENVLETFLSC